MTDLHSAAKMLALTGIKKLVYDAERESLRSRKAGPLDLDGDPESPVKDADEAGIDHANLPADPGADEMPDVEDTADALEPGEDTGGEDNAEEGGESDEEKLRKKAREMKK